MRIEHLRTNHVENPVGFLLEHISFSWIVTKARGKRTSQSRVEISRNQEFTDIVL